MYAICSLYKIALVSFSFCLLIGCIGCNDLHKANRRVVWIELSDGQTADDLFDLNLSMDVWEVKSRYVIAATYDRVIRKLNQHRYTTVILYASEEEYLAAIETNSYPVRIARVDCDTTLEREDLEALEMFVSDIVEQGEGYAIVEVTDEQLTTLFYEGYNVHLLYATKEDYLNQRKNQEGES